MKQILLALFLFPFILVKANTYYFSSVSGSDGRSSKQAQNPLTPWKSIDKLNTFFNQLSPGDVVLFKSGETFYGSLKLVENGKMQARSIPITFGSYGGTAKPVITGLRPVTGWTSIGNGIYEKQDNSFPDTLLNLVLVNGQLQPIGRWPKAGTANNGYLKFQSHIDTSSITSDAIASAKSFVGGEVVIRKVQWILDRGTVTDQTSNTVSYSRFIAPNHPTTTYEPHDNFGFFFQNHVNTLTANGDWCYDRTAKKLKMYSSAAPPSNVTVPDFPYLVNMAYEDNIIFDNIAFRGSNINTINIRASSNIQITNCDIDLSGVNGINVYYDFSGNAVKGNGSIKPKSTLLVSLGTCSNIKVTNCNISNTVNNAINGGNAPYWAIQNNKISNTGLIAGMGVSGDGQYSAIQYVNANSLLEKNKITNTGYLGIHFVGDNTIVRNNYVDNFCLIKSDGGGIYTYGQSGKNRRVTGNIVSNGIGDMNGTDANLNNPYVGQVHGIYMDAWSSDVLIDNNTCFNNAASGLFLGSNANILVTKNVFYNNTVAQVKAIDSHDKITNVDIKDNVLVATEKGQLVASYNLTWVGTYGNYKFGDVDYNYYCRPLYEPDDYMGQGYPNATSSTPFKDYPAGGIVEASDGVWGTTLFYSLNKWNTSLQQLDKNTKKSPFTIDDLSKLRFEYNATDAPTTIPLNDAYVDMKGVPYIGLVTLPPYSSIVLMKQPAQTAPTTYATTAAINNIQDNISVAAGITAYPNPSRSATTIRINPSASGMASVDLFDQQGRPVRRIFNGIMEAGVPRTFVVNLQGLANGSYIIKAVGKNKVWTKQIAVK
jgi:hypothetical protein